MLTHRNADSRAQAPTRVTGGLTGAEDLGVAGQDPQTRAPGWRALPGH